MALGIVICINLVILAIPIAGLTFLLSLECNAASKDLVLIESVLYPLLEPSNYSFGTF